MPWACRADNDAAENVDGENDDAGDGVAADELRRTVHGAEELGLVAHFGAALLGCRLVDQAGVQVGVDRHLLAGDGIERKPRTDFGDTRRALGDDEEVDGDQDEKDNQSDHEVAAHDEPREAADDIAGGGHAFRPIGEDAPCRRDVQCQTKQGRDKQHGREGREVERLLDPQGDHQDKHAERNREGEPEINKEGGDRQEEHC